MESAKKQPQKKYNSLKKAHLFLIPFSLGIFLFPVFSVYAKPVEPSSKFFLLESIKQQAHDLAVGYVEGFRLIIPHFPKPTLAAATTAPIRIFLVLPERTRRT
jgi:hypothetical protein